MHVVTVGDLLLDVIVDAPGTLRRDDDTDARIELLPGGQAANVAAWVVALGGRATLVGPRADTEIGALLARAMAVRGVRLVPLPVTRGGTVVSIVAGSQRTLVSDGGDQSWVDRLDAGVLPPDIDWLHVSAYPLLRAAAGWPVPDLAQAVRRSGGRVSLDLSSAAMIQAYGVERFRGEVARLGPDLVFANESEWQLLGTYGVTATLVLKRGRAGISVVTPTARDDYPAPEVDVVDVTGAGDAVCAGYLVGGPHVAVATAARCVARKGAQPGARHPEPSAGL